MDTNPDQANVDMEVDVDVTAYRDLLGNERTLYDGDVIFDEGTYSLSEGERATKSGFLRNLEDVAGEIKDILIEVTGGIPVLKKEDLWIRYHSKAPRDSTFGSRGYTSSHGSYSRRPLNDSEMEELIRKVDEKVRSLFYEED
jgi:hypothetical protein